MEQRARWLPVYLSLAFLCSPVTFDVASADVIVNDVSQLNPIHVNEVIAPTSVDEIVALVKRHDGPISIGGGRYSMGGQNGYR